MENQELGNLSRTSSTVPSKQIGSGKQEMHSQFAGEISRKAALSKVEEWNEMGQDYLVLDFTTVVNRLVLLQKLVSLLLGWVVLQLVG